MEGVSSNKAKALFLSDDCTHNLADVTHRFKQDPKGLGQWIRRKANDPANLHYVVLYHGTSSRHDILREGIKKTTSKSKKSIQSQPGFVYLSLYPNSAYLFGDIAYPYDKETTVYAVRVLLKDLCVDADQLKNKRSFGDYGRDEIKHTLAHSLIYGNGARVKRNIPIYDINVFGTYKSSMSLSAVA